MEITKLPLLVFFLVMLIRNFQVKIKEFYFLSVTH